MKLLTALVLALIVGASCHAAPPEPTYQGLTANELQLLVKQELIKQSLVLDNHTMTMKKESDPVVEKGEFDPNQVDQTFYVEYLDHGMKVRFNIDAHYDPTHKRIYLDDYEVVIN